nr:putative lipid II flippase MurJ [Ipomoea batatas]GMC97353.1 putative lipid II flippase MurJ [Ipomoea batatas]
MVQVVLLPILSTVSTLAEPIIRVLFERLAFNSSATSLVASLFICYSIGTPFFIVRELLVAVFYSLGDGQRPFLVSISAIALNAVLDWFLVCRYFLGGQGLALSTSATAALSVVILILLLQKKLAGVFHYAELIYPALLLSICCLVSSLTTSISHDLLVQMLTLICRKRLGRVAEALSICLASATGIISFFVPVILLYFSGFKMPGLSGLLGWLTNKPETVP